MIRGSVLCKGEQGAKDFAFQFITDIRDSADFYEIAIAEEIRDVGAVPCRFAVLEREFQGEVVEICFAAAFANSLASFTVGSRIARSIARTSTPFFSGYASLKASRTFRHCLHKPFEDFQNLFRCQFVLIISCRCKRCELAVYGSDHHRNLMCMLTEACAEWISAEVIALSDRRRCSRHSVR